MINVHYAIKAFYDLFQATGTPRSARVRPRKRPMPRPSSTRAAETKRKMTAWMCWCKRWVTWDSPPTRS